MFEFINVIIRNALHKPATRDYPRVARAPFDKQKGHIEIDLPNCIYCGMCSRKCPVGAIEVKRPDKQWSIDRFKCVMCNACVESCPKKCLDMDARPTPPATRKTVDIFRMPTQPDAPAKAAAPAAPRPVPPAQGENHGA